IIHRNITNHDTMTPTIQQYIWIRFKLGVDDPYVTGLRKFCHLTSRKVVKAMRAFCLFSTLMVWRDNEPALDNAMSRQCLREKGVLSHNFVAYFDAYTGPSG